VTGQARGDLRPVLRLQCLDRGGKEVAILHHDVATLAINEIANDGIDILPQHFAVGENGVGGQADPPQTLGTGAVLVHLRADRPTSSGAGGCDPLWHYRRGRPAAIHKKLYPIRRPL
jgi:hypothetical protein